MNTPAGWWPAAAVCCFEDLATYRLVGASACADRITAALAQIARESEEHGRDAAADLADAGGVMCALKPDTALYRNVVRVLLRAAVGGCARDVEIAADGLGDYRRAAQTGIVIRTQNLLEDADVLLVHDYSSMIERVLRGLAVTRPRRVVVTSGEPLGQGPKVARVATSAGHAVTYTPDMSVARIIDKVDGFITGVESFYPDGSLANTVGTTMLALLCREVGVPVVAPAEAFKCDLDHSSVTDVPLIAELLGPWPHERLPPEIDDGEVVRVVLDAVPASLVSRYVCETGVCDPGNVGLLAIRAVLELQDTLASGINHPSPTG